jgi:ribosome-binding protein aMBF1 (putative translation factor)
MVLRFERKLFVKAPDAGYSFVMARAKAYSRATRETAHLLGTQVRHGRLQRRWTLEDLSSRVGVSVVTMRKVERGDLGVALGTALEAANLVGVALYADPERRTAELRRVEDNLALLPMAARPDRRVDDDF